jgi:hypothetical protein
LKDDAVIGCIGFNAVTASFSPSRIKGYGKGPIDPTAPKGMENDLVARDSAGSAGDTLNQNVMPVG